MAAFDLNEAWSDGETKAELRSNKLDSALHPSSSIWSQILDSEPTALSNVENSSDTIYGRWVSSNCF